MAPEPRPEYPLDIRVGLRLSQAFITMGGVLGVVVAVNAIAVQSWVLVALGGAAVVVALLDLLRTKLYFPFALAVCAAVAWLYYGHPSALVAMAGALFVGSLAAPSLNLGASMVADALYHMARGGLRLVAESALYRIRANRDPEARTVSVSFGWVSWLALGAVGYLTYRTASNSSPTVWVGVLSLQAVIGALMATLARDASSQFATDSLNLIVRAGQSLGLLTEAATIPEETHQQVAVEHTKAAVNKAWQVTARSLVVMPLLLWVHGPLAAAVLVTATAWTAKDILGYPLLWWFDAGWFGWQLQRIGRLHGRGGCRFCGPPPSPDEH